MFYNAESFNQLLNNWNTNNIKIMCTMFYNAKHFNKDNCKDWDLTNIIINSCMFK